MNESFQYEPLDLSPSPDGTLYLRVLEVHPASSATDDIISCTLLHSSLRLIPPKADTVGGRMNDPEDYWEDNSDADEADLPEPVLFEPQHSYETISYAWGDASIRADVRVNERLMEVTRSAEQVLRRVQLQNKSRFIWIDAICIDQTNLDERAHQVALMTKLYRHGERNLVYLGEAHDSTASALTAMDSLRATEDLGPEFFLSDDQSHIILSKELALAQFFSRSWFK